jgi:hypothetical protein
VNKTASYYISDINNGTSYALSSLPVTSYLGFDAFFKNSNWWGDYNYGTNWATSFVQDVSIEAVAGNTTPILTLTDFNGNNPDGTLGNFKGVRDLDFNVSDAENERLTLNVYISNSTAQDTSGDHIITDLNLTTTYCSSETWTSDVNCHVDVNTLLASDGSTKYIKVIVTDGTFTAYDFTSSLGVDNTKPIVSWTGVSSDWVRSGTSVTLNCTDAVAGCSVKRYRINSGTWNTYSTPLSITTGDGNYLFEVDANDTIGNQADTNSFYVLVGYNGKLRTYNDSNKARSFFGLRERAKIVYDANLIYAPTITITDSNGSTVNYGTMVNISNDGNLGLADYNTYYFNYDLNGAYGWYNVLIQNQYF